MLPSVSRGFGNSRTRLSFRFTFLISLERSKLICHSYIRQGTARYYLSQIFFGSKSINSGNSGDVLLPTHRIAEIRNSRARRRQKYILGGFLVGLVGVLLERYVSAVYRADTTDNSSTTTAIFSNAANTATVVNAPVADATSVVAVAAVATVDQYEAQTRTNNCISFLAA